MTRSAGKLAEPKLSFTWAVAQLSPPPMAALSIHPSAIASPDGAHRRRPCGCAADGVFGQRPHGQRVLSDGQVGIAEHSTFDDRAVLATRPVFPIGRLSGKGKQHGGFGHPLVRFKGQHSCFARPPKLAERFRRLGRPKIDPGAGRGKDD